MNRRVAVCGSHPDSQDKIPWDDPTIDIFVINERAMDAPRFDASFQMHDATVYRNPENRSNRKYWNWMECKHDKPVYMQEYDKLVPDCVVFPLQDLIEKLHCEPKFFTSGPAYALAMAIYLEYEELELYGVEMASQTEYFYQRDCIAYWWGLAQGRGIKCTRYCADNVFTRPLYGYEGKVEQTIDEFKARLDQLYKDQVNSRLVTLHDNENFEAACRNGENIEVALGALAASTIELGRLDGAIFECERYDNKVRAMHRRTGHAMLDRNEFEKAAAAARDEFEKNAGLVHRTVGRVDVLLENWRGQTDDNKAQAMKMLRQFVTQHLVAAQKYGYIRGVVEENWRLKADWDEKTRAAGGEKSVPAWVQAAIRDNETERLEEIV